MHVNGIDKRKKLIAVVAHCLLNQNTVVKPLASHEGAVVDLVKLLVESGYGIVQLPCPEALYLGMKRWWMSREQYDVQLYKDFVQGVLKPYVLLLKELVLDGCKYVVIGVQGSPSCAVKTSTSNPHWGGKPAVDLYPGSTKIEKPGVFMEVLFGMVKYYGIPGPVYAVDIDHEEVSKYGLPRELIEALTKLSKTQAY